jgi:hypothetical protein
VYSGSGSSINCTHYHIVDEYADVTEVNTTLVEEEVFTFKAGSGSSAGKSVSYLLDLWCHRLEKVSNKAPLREYKLNARGCWTSGTVIDWENKPLDSVEGEVGVMENGEDEDH